MQIEEMEKDSMSDQEFIARTYKEYERLMYYTARKYNSNLQTCEDIMQEALIRLIKKVDLLRTLNEYALINYIVVTIRNLSIDVLKKAGVEQKKVISISDIEDRAGAHHISLDDALIKEEKGRKLAQVLQEMDPQDRWLLECRYFLDYDDEQLANGLGCQPRSVRMKLTRARRKALKLMEGGGQIGTP